MDKLNIKDLDEVLNLINVCISSLKIGSEITDLLTEMQKAFRSDELVFLCPNQEGGGIDLSHSLSLQRDRSFLTRYANYYWRLDPLYQAEFCPEYNKLVFRTDDVIPYPQIVKLEYYYDFLQPQNLHSELIMRLCFHSSFLGVISVLRSKEQPFFNKNDIQKAEFIIPYIVNTLEISEMFSKSNEEQILFEQWLESQLEGIILLDSDLQPLYYNSRAKLFCLLLSGKSIEGLSDPEHNCIPIPYTILQDCKYLVKSYKDNNLLNNYDNRIVNAKNKKRYHIQYFLIASKSPELPTPRFIVVINDLSRYINDVEEIILNEFKLSRREAVVAQYASLGLTNKEIANNTHSSPFTIQNHLKNVFEKTGLKNRTQLANLMKYSGSLFS